MKTFSPQSNFPASTPQAHGRPGDVAEAGIVNLLAADKLMKSPRLYATFLLWMLSELFETLPEVGHLDKPKMVFFFDEAHLLLNEALSNEV
jgi:DNA helicase HerA-like ATPase